MVSFNEWSQGIPQTGVQTGPSTLSLAILALWCVAALVLLWVFWKKKKQQKKKQEEQQ